MRRCSLPPVARLQPAKETYGAQPPIELLRQYMDHGGWYDRRDKEKSFMEIVDTQFAGACEAQ